MLECHRGQSVTNVSLYVLKGPVIARRFCCRYGCAAKVLPYKVLARGALERELIDFHQVSQLVFSHGRDPQKSEVC